MKIPVMLIVGEKEADQKTVSVRRRHEGNLGAQAYDAFLDELILEIKERKRGKSNSKN